MRQLKTPEEIRNEVPEAIVNYVEQCILAAQRDALECIENCIPKIEYPMNGFAPGKYMCRCGKCDQMFYGDKRAVRCEACAFSMYIDYIKSAISDLMNSLILST